MTTLSKAALLAFGVVALTATTASAEIACNREGDCWHVKEHHGFKPEFGIVVHPDNWKWAKGEEHKYRWREHEGHGYWHNGLWIKL